MARALCDGHQPEPDGAGAAGYVLPLGYPDRAVTCDVVGCARPARLWLSKDERAAFIAGERSFTIGSGARVRVSGDLFPG